MPDDTGTNRDDKGRFKSGYSGNINGRPKNAKSIPDFMRKIANEENGDGYTKLECILRKVFDEALKGTRWAVEFIANRIEGRPFQAVYTSPIDLPSGFITKNYDTGVETEFIMGTFDKPAQTIRRKITDEKD